MNINKHRPRQRALQRIEGNNYMNKTEYSYSVFYIALSCVNISINHAKLKSEVTKVTNNTVHYQ